MTLEETIRFIKQALENVNHGKRVHYEFRLTVEQVKRLLAFLQELKLFRETFGDVKNTKFCIPECKEGCENLVKQYESENAELKRLLMLAVDDFDKMANVESCYYPFCGEKCPFDCAGGCEEREWKHRDEAMKLLGGADNDEN